jgi:predicted phage-related endonuclease
MESTGRRVKLDGRLIYRTKRPWQSCTLDAVQWDEERGRGLAEFKTSLFGWDADGIPEDYYCQIQHQFATTGMSWGTAIMFNRTSCEMVWKDVFPDEEYITRLVDEEYAFWTEYVLAGVPPPADGHDATTKALRRLYPVHEDGKVIAFPVSLLDVRDTRALAVETLAKATATKAETDNVFKLALEDAERGEFPDGSGFKYKANKNGVRSLRVVEPRG